MSIRISSVRRRVAVFVAAAACALGLAAVPCAWAAPQSYNVWVSGTEITSENAGDVFGDGTVRLEHSSSQNDLYLNGADLTLAPVEGGIDGKPAAAAIVDTGQVLYVHYEGDNTITNGDVTLPTDAASVGIYHNSTTGVLVMGGDGSLNIDLKGADGPGGRAIGLQSEEAIILNTSTGLSIQLTPGDVPSNIIGNGLYGAVAKRYVSSQGGSISVVCAPGANTAIGFSAPQVSFMGTRVSVDAEAANICAAAAATDSGDHGLVSVSNGTEFEAVCTSPKMAVGFLTDSVYLYHRSYVCIDAVNKDAVADQSAAYGMHAYQKIEVYQEAEFDISGTSKAIRGPIDLSRAPNFTALVSDGTTTDTWDGETPLSGNDSPYKRVISPGGGTIERIAGDYANETSAKISEKAFPEGSEWAIIARDDDFADALGATGLAGVLQAPIVLTDRMELSEAAAAEITRLGVKKAYIIGGTGAIKEQVDADLAALGVDVQPRVAGENSYDTSLECAKKIVEHRDGEVYLAIVAMSTNFQDALSISPYAYRAGAPVILQTWGATSADRGFTDEAKEFLNNKWITIVGGPGAISDESFEGIEFPVLPWSQEPLKPQRIYGETGYDTSNEIAWWGVSNNVFSPTSVVVACGAQAPKGVDALSGAALAGKLGCPILLVNSNEAMEGADTTTIDDYLSHYGKRVRTAYVLGGTYVIPQDLYDKVASLAPVSEA